MDTSASISDRQRQLGVEPPCIGMCSINPETQVCGGCYRHMDEIVTWALMSAAERERAFENMRARKAAAGVA